MENCCFLLSSMSETGISFICISKVPKAHSYNNPGNEMLSGGEMKTENSNKS